VRTVFFIYKAVLSPFQRFMILVVNG